MLVGGGAAAAVQRVRSSPGLPATTPSRLIASALSALARPRPVSGQVLARIDLGLPSLPQAGPQPTGAAGLIAALSGEQRIRVWASADGLRVDEMLPLAERALYVTRQGAWAWDSSSFTATHLADFPTGVPSVPAALGQQAEASQLLELTDPSALARTALAAISPTTAVSMGPPARVAGRACYVVALTPRQPDTLVGRVDVAIDAATRLPIRVEVFAKAARSPAVSVAFSSLSLAPIDPAVYRFAPPPGATVTRPSGPEPEHGVSGTTDAASNLDGAVRVFGTGWSSVVAVKVPPAPMGRDLGDGVTLRELLPFSGPLFSARLVTRGDHDWLLVGAVPQTVLARVEPDLS
jgi:outer membrane lipoprotein-sorting protein